jgi:hypothetical protein
MFWQFVVNVSCLTVKINLYYLLISNDVVKSFIIKKQACHCQTEILSETERFVDMIRDKNLIQNFGLFSILSITLKSAEN